MKKECVHTLLHKAQELKINFNPDYKQQIDLIEEWVKKEETKVIPTRLQSVGNGVKDETDD